MTAPAPERPMPNELDEPIVPEPGPDVPPPYEPPPAPAITPDPFDPMRRE